MDIPFVISKNIEKEIFVNGKNLYEFDVFNGDILFIDNQTEDTTLWIHDRENPSIIRIKSTGASEYPIPLHSDFIKYKESDSKLYDVANAKAELVNFGLQTPVNKNRQTALVSVNGVSLAEGKDYSFDQGVISTVGKLESNRIAFSTSSVPAENSIIEIRLDTVKYSDNFVLADSKVKLPISKNIYNTLWIFVGNEKKIKLNFKQKSDDQFLDEVTPLIPEQMRGANPAFEKLLSDFFDYAKAKGNPLDTLRNLSRNMDFAVNADRADVVSNTYLQGFPTNIKADKTNVLRHSSEFYHARGTYDSFGFYGRIVFGQDISYYSPKESIFKSSASEWIDDSILRVNSIRDYLASNPSRARFFFEFFGPKNYSDIDSFGESVSLQYLQGTVIFGANTGSTAVVEEVIQTVEGGKLLTDLKLSNLKGKFAKGEIILYQNGFPSDQIVAIGGPIVLHSVCASQVVSFADFTGNVSEGDTVSIDSTGCRAYIRSAKEGKPTSVLLVNSGAEVADGVLGIVRDKFGDVKGTAKAVVDTIKYAGGYTKNKNGVLSNSSYRLQDNFYYQKFSYVLISEIDHPAYVQSYKTKMHPAGYQMFTQNIKTEYELDITGDPNFYFKDTSKNLSAIKNFVVREIYNGHTPIYFRFRSQTIDFGSYDGATVIGEPRHTQFSEYHTALININTYTKQVFEDTSYNAISAPAKIFLDNATSRLSTERCLAIRVGNLSEFTPGKTLTTNVGQNAQVLATYLMSTTVQYILVEPVDYKKFLEAIK